MSTEPSLAALQKKLGVVFRDQRLLETALTHRSYCNEHRKVREHNERLEWLGDAALEWVVSQHLYRQYPQESEGNLTNIRAKVVCGATLSHVAEELGLENYLRLSRGEKKNMSTSRIAHGRILTGVLEAVIGAIAIDRGLGCAELFVTQFLLPLCDRVVKTRAFHHPLSYLQELLEEKLHLQPRYEVLKAAGLDHEKQFTVGCYVSDRLLAQGSGASKRTAMTAAAKRALRDEFRIELPEDKDVLFN